MKRYRYLPHTADVSFVGYGRSAKEALENSALALLNVMLDLKRIKGLGGRERSISIKESANDADELIWFVLQDIVSKVDARSLNAYRLRVLDFGRSKKGFQASCRLLYKDSKEDTALLGVKAVTPHDLHLKRSNGIYSVKVVVDV